jgi:hypothetical protein
VRGIGTLESLHSPGPLPIRPELDPVEHTGTGLSWVPALQQEEDGINYLHTDVLAYAAKIMAAVEGHEGIRCGWLEDTGRPCGEPATYLAAGGDLVASDTPVDAGDDVKSGPQWLCREHLELVLGAPRRISLSSGT